jgi:hypothetical protein
VSETGFYGNHRVVSEMPATFPVTKSELRVPERAVFAAIFSMKSGRRQALNVSVGTAPQGHKSSARRSTRLSLQIPVVITSLDPVRIFAGKHDTLVVNAHGCGVIVREQLEKGTQMTVELVSNGRIKKARVVLVRPLMEGVSWLLGT